MNTEQAHSARTEGESLLSVGSLRTSFYTGKEVTHAIDGISLDILRGETVGTVGESGSGKSVAARPIIRLVEKPGRIENGRIMYSGEDLLDKLVRQIRSIRGDNITMVSQDPLASLNPVYTAGNQIKETPHLHRGLSGPKAAKEVIELLEAVGTPDAHHRVRGYLHQSSGGMCQHVAITMALVCDPELLICDGSTTAFDVTIQAQILEFFEELREERDPDIMLTTHDVGIIAEIVDRVNAMYVGEIVESAPVVELFESPKYPHTQGLLNSIPGQGLDENKRLATIEGDVPTPNEGPTYCRFVLRCPKAFAECGTVHPELAEVGDGTGRHRASCLLYPDDPPTEKAVAVRREGGQHGDDMR